jgi:hypothetical protein
VQIGRSVIADLNLTSMMADRQGVSEGGVREDCCSHAFLSFSDFVSVVSKHKGAPLQLMQNLPRVAASVAAGIDSYQAVMELVDSAKQSAILMYAQHILEANSDLLNSTRANGSNASNGSDGLHDAGQANASAINERLRAMVDSFSRMHARDAKLLYAYANEVVGVALTAGSSAEGEEGKLSVNIPRGEEATGSGSSGPGRRLMQSSGGVGGITSIVDSYSSLVASTKGFSNIAVSSAGTPRTGTPLVTETWLEGPFGWPPKVSYMTLDEETLKTVGVKSGDEVFITRDRKTLFLRAGTSAEFNGLIRLMGLELLVPGGDNSKYEFETCSASLDGFESVAETFAVLKLFYDTEFKVRFDKVGWDLGSNIPQLYYARLREEASFSSPFDYAADSSGSWDGLRTRLFSLDDQSSWGPSFYTFVADSSQQSAPWVGEGVSGFFTLNRGGDVPEDALTVGNLVHGTLVCKFDNVMFCGKERQQGV